ncbi:MAG: hypothetical protein ACRDSE_10845 [Pseudonocardiaceae bacterium]
MDDLATLLPAFHQVYGVYSVQNPMISGHDGEITQVLAGGAAAANLPWYAISTLPVLFTAGMTTLDAINGGFMNVAYGWSFATPVRKVFYNLTITGLSVAVALLIVGFQLIGLVVERFGIITGPLAWIAGLDLGSVGYAIAGVFLLAWLLAIGFWRLGRIERRWVPDGIER